MLSQLLADPLQPRTHLLCQFLDLRLVHQVEHGDRGWGFGLRAGDWKLIETEGQPDELYHLERDPRERRNLAAARADRVQALSQQIRTWRREQAAKAEARSEKISDEVRAGLEALGYGESAPGESTPEEEELAP